MPEPVLEKKGNDSGGLDYKAKLDEAADRVKKQAREEQSPGTVSKVSQYVPALGAMLRASRRIPVVSHQQQRPHRDRPNGPIMTRRSRSF
ncbi:hypothetical protein MYCTH_2302235 [Thermothelomyces thermophilus ATCC 42464]|uniref:Uncharacterized protein n=1 Tax=Thermothelomyces thermophilus (strain ATCC 42464 / BCRC 31852 / DSM 1799) TaxID=573729 RepID=G2QBA6_THET4|nr:uncharacterized protein MYCTH_2302235 [Thermothelomyces thermophilus ATCC 42464]AEO56845.1 hypothetical protein MYCTH_2302235 [Thermothelomyces thermophilus ATCC 42464]